MLIHFGDEDVNTKLETRYVGITNNSKNRKNLELNMQSTLNHISSGTMSTMWANKKPT